MNAAEDGAERRAADARLVARIAVGDERALAEVFDLHAPFVHGLARRVTASAAAAEDVVQETILHLWEAPDVFDSGRGSLRSFLAVIAHRRSVDWVRREERHRRRTEREASQPVVVVHDATDVVEGSDRAARLRRAVAQLPAEQQRAIELAYFDGCTYREVAVRLSIPEGTAKSRLRLGLARLVDLLAAEGIAG